MRSRKMNVYRLGGIAATIVLLGAGGYFLNKLQCERHARRFLTEGTRRARREGL